MCLGFTGWGAVRVADSRPTKPNICRHRHLVVLSKYYVQYDQTEPDMFVDGVSYVTKNEEIAFILNLLRNGEISYAKQRFKDNLRDSELSAGTYARLISALGYYDGEEGAEQIHRAAGWRLNSSDFPVIDHALLKEYAKAGNESKLLESFSALKNPTVSSRCAIVKFYCKAGRFKDAEKYTVDDMRCLNILLHAYLQFKKFDLASKLLRHIDQSSSLKRNKRTFNILLNSVNEINAAESMVEDMMAARILPDVATYTTLMGVYIKKGDVSGATKTFVRMKESGVKPNISTFNMLVFALHSCGQSEDAYMMLDEMNRLSIYPNTVTFNRLIRAQVELGEVQLGRDLFEHMGTGKYHHQRNIYTFNTMLAGYAKDGKIIAVEKLFQRLLNSGLVPNEVTYVTMMDAYSRKGKPLAVRKYLRKMKRSGISPSARAMSSLVIAWARDGNVDAAKAALRESRRMCLEPNVYAHTALIGALTEKGEVEEAENFLKHMLIAGPEPTLVSYNTLLAGYARLGRSGDAERLLSSLLRRKLDKPNVVTFTTIMTSYAKQGNLHGVRSVLHRMIKQGLRPNEKTIGVVLNACKESNNIEQTYEALRLMEDYEIPPNAVICGTVITLFARRRDGAGAMAIFERMVSQGMQPNTICYLTLIHALVRAGERERVSAVVEDALERGIELPAAVYKADRRRRWH